MTKAALRDVMPQTAELVDWMRELLGREKADAQIAGGRAGRGSFYAAEIGPDGVFREFGSTAGGQRAQARDGAVVWQDDADEVRPC